ncbi:DUF6600 domain-containing protein [Undibacterium sp. Ji50W]|uniref:DUF6600 domain-containing protein n=1 Tax=Undibacterium sp. Ji50W TaxID=3413041 RepID=UPI003BEFE711
MSANLRSTPVLSIAALLIATLFVQVPARAQDEPPGRVARVSYSYGDISFADAGTDNWSTLIPNRPIASGDSLIVAPSGRAELHVGANAVRLQEGSRISFTTLNDENTQIDMKQGSMILRVRTLAGRENFDVSTPNLVFSVQEPGEYRITVNYDNSTTILVRSGTGIALGDRDTITIRAGEQSRFSGSNLQHTQIGSAPPPDTFDMWAADRDRAEENVTTARYVSREVIGYEQLDDYGAWETTVEYGAVWYPRQVSSTWAPYRDGKWVWVAPWGWTWIDRAPWGFAPYHYGRWAYVGTRWAWVPGQYHVHQRPVYAPALVAFVGNSNIGINPSNGHRNTPGVAWFPLGPGEAYHPGYTHNSNYIQRLNQNVVINNNTVINNNRVVYVNQNIRNAVTVVPTQTFVRGEHVLPASTTKIIVENQRTPVVTEAPALVPGNNNRFGEARPQNVANGDQYRQRILKNAQSQGVPQGAGINAPMGNVNATPRPQDNATNRSYGNGISNNGNNANNRPSVNVAPVQTAPANTVTVAPPASVNAPVNTNPAINQRPADNNTGVRQYGNGGQNNYAGRPQNNVAPAQNAAPIVSNPPVSSGIGASLGNSINPPVHSPNTNSPANNAIMTAPNTRPADNIDRTQRQGGGRSWDNNGQGETRNERAVERMPDRPVVERPVERPRASYTPPVERPPQMAPMPQPQSQPAPRVEARPAPAPVAMPAPMQAPAPAPRAEKPKEKEETKAKQHGLNEHER